MMAVLTSRKNEEMIWMIGTGSGSNMLHSCWRIARTMWVFFWETPEEWNQSTSYSAQDTQQVLASLKSEDPDHRMKVRAKFVLWCGAAKKDCFFGLACKFRKAGHVLALARVKVRGDFSWSTASIVPLTLYNGFNIYITWKYSLYIIH